MLLDLFGWQTDMMIQIDSAQMKKSIYVIENAEGNDVSDTKI